MDIKGLPFLSVQQQILDELSVLGKTVILIGSLSSSSSTGIWFNNWPSPLLESCT